MNDEGKESKYIINLIKLADTTCLVYVFFIFLVLSLTIIQLSSPVMQCDELGKVLDYETEWHYNSGCVVIKPDGDKVLLKYTKVTNK